MPIRAFVTKTFVELTQEGGIIDLLEQSMRSGSINILKNTHTGFLTQTAALSPSDVQRLYAQARYEAFLRVQALDSADPNKTTLSAQWTNPYREKIMKVETVRTGPFVNTIFPSTP